MTLCAGMEDKQVRTIHAVRLAEVAHQLNVINADRTTAMWCMAAAGAVADSDDWAGWADLWAKAAAFGVPNSVLRNLEHAICSVLWNQQGFIRFKEEAVSG